MFIVVFVLVLVLVTCKLLLFISENVFFLGGVGGLALIFIDGVFIFKISGMSIFFLVCIQDLYKGLLQGLCPYKSEQLEYSCLCS